MASIEGNLALELRHLGERIGTMEATLTQRITETRTWLDGIARKLDGNGHAGMESRLTRNEVLVGEILQAVEDLTDRVRESQVLPAPLKSLQDKALEVVVQMVITGAVCGGMMFALWERGLLK